MTVLKDHSEYFFSEYYSSGNFPSLSYFVIRTHKNFNDRVFDDYRKTMESRITSDLLSLDLSSWIKKQKSLKLDSKSYVENSIAWVQDHIRYMGDWRTTDGQLIPRRIPDILNTEYGDCKDFSALTIRILRELGLKAHIAHIFRKPYSKKAYDTSFEESYLANINHAVVYVIDGKQKRIVDPTNQVSSSESWEDIVDRDAVVFAEKIFIHKTPHWKDISSKFIESFNITFKDDIQFSKCKLNLKGLEASSLQQFYYKRSPKINETEFVHFVMGQPLTYKIKHFPEFDNRIIKDLKFEYEWTSKSSSIKTPQGNVVEISNPFLGIIDLDTSDRISEIQVPRIIRSFTNRYRNSKIIGFDANKMKIKIDSKWINISVNLFEEGNDIVLKLDYETLEDTIKVDEFNSEKFLKFKENYNRLMRNQGFIIKSSLQPSA